MPRARTPWILAFLPDKRCLSPNVRDASRVGNGPPSFQPLTVVPKYTQRARLVTGRRVESDLAKDRSSICVAESGEGAGTPLPAAARRGRLETPR